MLYTSVCVKDQLSENEGHYEVIGERSMLKKIKIIRICAVKKTIRSSDDGISIPLVFLGASFDEIEFTGPISDGRLINRDSLLFP